MPFSPLPGIPWAAAIQQAQSATSVARTGRRSPFRPDWRNYHRIETIGEQRGIGAFDTTGHIIGMRSRPHYQHMPMRCQRQVPEALVSPPLASMVARSGYLGRDAKMQANGRWRRAIGPFLNLG
jgi:hypothetical protein